MAITTKPVITFDAGQTLVELDLDFLAARLGERGVAVEPQRLGAAAPAAWARYDELVSAGRGHPWHALMDALLTGAGITDATPHVQWLWQEQPRANLWRKPIPAMLDLARDLAASGAIVGVLSNSEGKLAELFEEIGIARTFAAIIDSGRVGIEKPDPRIFAHALAALGADDPGIEPRIHTRIDTPIHTRIHTRIHIGDSWAADIAGARAAGWRAIWFGPKVAAVDDDPLVAVARDATEARAALTRWGVL